LDNEDSSHHNNAGVLLSDVLYEAGEKGRSAHHGGYDTVGGEYKWYSFTQGKPLTTSGFPVIRKGIFATAYQVFAAYALAEEAVYFG
jgi:hypothetical protein